MTLRFTLAIAALTVICLNAAAIDGDKPDTKSGMMFAPLVFDNYDVAPLDAAQEPSNTLYNLDAGDQWLKDAMGEASRTRQVRQRAMIARGRDCWRSATGDAHHRARPGSR